MVPLLNNAANLGITVKSFELKLDVAEGEQSRSEVKKKTKQNKTHKTKQQQHEDVEWVQFDEAKLRYPKNYKPSRNTDPDPAFM